ncbi:MAG: hypothetical protein V3V13_00080 [Paracoccaceae bacterium]
MKNLLTFVMVFCTGTALGMSATPEGDADQFLITVSNGIVIDQSSAGVVVRYAADDSWRIETHHEIFAMEVSFDGTPESESTDINDRNNFLAFLIPNGNGGKTQIICQPDRENPKGYAKRTVLSEDHVVVEIELKLIRCSDMGDNVIDYPELPLTVTGSFSLGLVGVLEGLKRRPKSN